MFYTLYVLLHSGTHSVKTMCIEPCQACFLAASVINVLSISVTWEDGNRDEFKAENEFNAMTKCSVPFTRFTNKAWNDGESLMQ